MVKNSGIIRRFITISKIQFIIFILQRAFNLLLGKLFIINYCYCSWTLISLKRPQWYWQRLISAELKTLASLWIQKSVPLVIWKNTVISSHCCKYILCIKQRIFGTSKLTRFMFLIFLDQFKNNNNFINYNMHCFSIADFLILTQIFFAFEFLNDNVYVIISLFCALVLQFWQIYFISF